MERVEKFFNCVDKNNWVFAIFVIIVFVVAVAFVWLISRIIKEWDKKKAIENHVEKWRH